MVAEPEMAKYHITITLDRYRELIRREQILCDLYKLKMQILAAKEKKEHFHPPLGASSNSLNEDDAPLIILGTGGEFQRLYTTKLKKSPFVPVTRKVMALGAIYSQRLGRFFGKRKALEKK